MLKKHGMSRTSLYNKWCVSNFRGMLCDEWKDNFQAFYDWAMANGYKEGLYLLRIDRSKVFSPDNCWWEKNILAFGNSRSRYLTYNGETHTVTEWAEKLGMKRITLYRRLDSGWSVEKALTEPIDSNKDTTKWRKQ